MAILPNSYPDAYGELGEFEKELYNHIRDTLSGIGGPVDGNVPALADIRERVIHIENKINTLLTRTDNGEFHGHPDQRYGHLTYSQHGEDLVFVALLERLGIDKPTYLDVGANHPVNCSNTALLYKRGARGINIDADPDAIALFNQARPDDCNINIGIAGAPGTLKFSRLDATSPVNTFSEAALQELLANKPWLKIKDRFDIPVLTIDQVVDKYCDGRYPDLVSVDAEGLDYDIIAAAAFRTRPSILCVETISPAGNSEAEMDDLMKSKGFRKYVQMYANAIYVDQQAVV